jgi:hypothetical protein
MIITATRRHLPAALVAAITLLLAVVGSARATPVNAISVNTVNWTGSAGFGSTAPGWYQDSFGLIHLQGAARQISLTPPLQRVIGTLPPAARPTRNVFTIAHSSLGTYADFEIETNGFIYVIGAAAPAVEDLSFVSLESVVYQPANALPASPIALNGTNWSPTTAFGTIAPAWFKDGSGIIHLEGAARQNTPLGPTPNFLGRLPVGARPTRSVYTIVNTSDGLYADVAILPDGSISLVDARPPLLRDYHLYVSLESISFQTSFPVGSMSVNTANWSGTAGFGSTAPGWYLDGAGVIHLQGAATQMSTLGPKPDLVAVLPAVARPSRTVYTVADTLFGTYADHAIPPTGEVYVVPPRPPAVQDFRFLSLEGITYQQ